MTRQARTDLRDRMERVASKPAQHSDAPRRTRATQTRQTPAAATRRRSAASQRPAPVHAEPDLEPTNGTRLDTLTRWAQWELVSVPRERLRWMKELLLG